MKVFILRQSIWNGTVLLRSDLSAFNTRELAEKVLSKLKYVHEKNIEYHHSFPATYEIVEVELMTSEEQVPILKNND